uniref:NADH dehydrogenase subunit 2 n=1 Tax=Drepanocentron fuxiensis TaxID=3058442 RepID=UPI0026E3782B|nr:NADH dehydrogenase subunit 2 [Drepanocentron fuxiensis]WJW73307.1 NADH dehydrogenase subunit 2 [Drepanocentron fuxiensis]
MYFNSSKMMTIIIMMLSIILCLSSNSWMIMWISMEINMFMFITLLNQKSLFSSESLMKYFFIQTISSLILFMAIMIIWNSNNSNNFYILIMNLCLLMKLSSAPFHFWFIQIIESMNWLNFYLISTTQKIIPLVLLNFNMNLFMITIFTLLNFIMSAPSGLNQNSLKKILGYSSINHLGWMILTLNINESLWYLYMTSYLLILATISFMFNYMNISYMNQMFYFNNFFLNLMFFSLTFLSLGGIPPFMGFIPKWMTINFLIMNNQLFMLMIMMMSSLTVLFFYIQPLYTNLLMNSLKNKWFINMNLVNMKFIIFNLIYLSLFTFIIMLIMYI